MGIYGCRNARLEAIIVFGRSRDLGPLEVDFVVHGVVDRLRPLLFDMAIDDMVRTDLLGEGADTGDHET